MRRSSRIISHYDRGLRRLSLAFCFAALAGLSLRADTWTWTYERVDAGGKFTSLAVDRFGDVHLSFVDDSAHVVKYAFRSHESSRWFTLDIDRNLQSATTHIALDSQGNPHICYSDRPTIKLASWNGQRWLVQELAPGGTKEYTCSLVISPGGTPYVTWYQTHSSEGINYFHLRSAVLEEGAWLARTVDFEGEAGKWTSMALDNQGRPYLSYTICPPGELRLAHWEGNHWVTSYIDSLSRDTSNKTNRGMGNSLRMGPQGGLCVSYFAEAELRYAVQELDHWAIQKVSDIIPHGSWAGYLSSLDFDHAGHPHISYDDGGAVKHAFWDGKTWRIQAIASGGGDPYRYSSLGVGPDDTIYISYRDPQDGSLKVAIGRPSNTPSPSASPAGSPNKN